ncbi:hypothetical protein U0070_001456 [Myodes glareolus]|uniref:Uncharacterized protein n=1 Tax=Myodes glareolus TaxID=447135 RepID=A0AAW0IGX4_MYOGA
MGVGEGQAGSQPAAPWSAAPGRALGEREGSNGSGNWELLPCGGRRGRRFALIPQRFVPRPCREPGVWVTEKKVTFMKITNHTITPASSQKKGKKVYFLKPSSKTSNSTLNLKSPALHPITEIPSD